MADCRVWSPQPTCWRHWPATHSVIVLYSELPVVVAAKEHAIEAADSVTLADLAGFVLIGGDAPGDPDVRASDSAESRDSGWPAAIELAATNVGVVIVPQSVARAHSRRDVIVRPVTDGAQTRIALVWLSERGTPEVDEFVGIVRGRTANSSRGRDGDDSADNEATDAAAGTSQRSAGGVGSGNSGKTGAKTGGKTGAGAKSGNGANAAPKRTGPRPPRKNQLKAYKKKPKRF